MQSVFRGALWVLVVLVSSSAAAQSSGAAGSSGSAGTAQAPQTPVRVPGSSVTVTAQKEPADPAALPVSISTVQEDLIKASGVTFVSDAGIFSPNTQFTEFSARKLSNPRIRGIGASPANPGVITYVDGVPQLNSNTSSFDLVDIGQIEFVRGAQGALFGRNALGGLINITSGRPSMAKWSGNVFVPFGSDGQFDVRANASGPIAKDALAAGFSVAFSERDGFTKNAYPQPVTSSSAAIDSREAFSAKGQVLWTPQPGWEVRGIVAGERARDGDYALNDLDAVRAKPFEVMRDFEGFTNRDLFTTTAIVRKESKRFTFVSTTGFVDWKTVDETDLDYSPFPLATRRNAEDATQFTEELRFASAPAATHQAVGHGWTALAGRHVLLHAELCAGCGEHDRAVRAVTVGSSDGCEHIPQGRTGRCRYQRLWAGHARVFESSRRVVRRAPRPREPESRSPDGLRFRVRPDLPVGHRERREVVQRRLAAGGRRVPRNARNAHLWLGVARVQGRRLQSRLDSRQ